MIVGRIVVIENLSLDGVMQAPGAVDEDPRDGFGHGGWAMPYNDADKGRIMAGGMAQAGPLLFGRRTYDSLFTAWSGRTDNPFSAVLDNAPKHVVSTTLAEPLPWINSSLIAGDVAAGMRRLKAASEEDITVMGSGELVRWLMSRDFVDAYVLLIHPLVLGSGRRLFPDDGGPAAFRLSDTQTTGTGVIIATFDRAAPGGGANAATGSKAVPAGDTE